ncbi:hypothetical protein ABBQ38_014665 [Trebouxia sp. C0009 RCD-2024]
MPSTGNEQVITSAADRQVRLVNLHRRAIKPYTFHHGRVKALVPIDPYMFMSGSDDGTVRHYDVRDPASSTTIPGMRTGEMIADQRHERTLRGRGKVSINTVAVDPMRPHLFATGSSDPLVRLYDRRVSGQRGNATGRSRPQWASCFVPTSLKTGSTASPSGIDRAPFLTSVKFSVGGDQVFASYSGDHIYSFDCVDHARDSEDYYNAQGWSRPSSAAGTRSASRHAVLHASAALGPATSSGHAMATAANGAMPSADEQGTEHHANTATQTDGTSEAVNGAGPMPSAPAETAEGSASGRQASIRGGGLTAAAASAVAQIRRRRNAARSQSLHLPVTSSAAMGSADTGLDAMPAEAAASAVPAAAVPTMTDLSHLQHHHGLLQPGPVITRAAEPSSAAPQLSGGSPAAHSQPAEVADQAAADNSRDRPLVDRAASVSRPPLPFHPIRRSARLHKTSDTAPSVPSLGPDARDQADTQCGSGHASAIARPVPDANTATEASGPCTRHSCKRKLADLSKAAPSTTEQPQAAVPKAQRPFQHVPPAKHDEATPAGSAPTLKALHQQPHSHAEQDTAQAAEGLAACSQAHQGLSAPHVTAAPGACSTREDEEQVVLPEGAQQARQFRHCSSLHSVADAAEHSQNGQQHTSARSDGCQAPQHACRDRQHDQQEAESLNAQNVEACVASSRRLEQPTASTGTSRPVPVLHRGVAVQTSQAGENVTMAPPEFLRLQYSTDPPLSAENSRETSPEQSAGAAQAAPAGMQVPSQPPGIHNFPHPSRHPRRARASRLAPHPANSTAHVPETASTAVPAPDVASRQSDDATAQSQDHSQQRAGPAMSASAEAQTCAGQEVNGHAQGEGDAAALVQPREGTPVSSNRRHYRAQSIAEYMATSDVPFRLACLILMLQDGIAQTKSQQKVLILPSYHTLLRSVQARGRASVEASNAPRAPTWHRSNNAGAQGERSSGNSLLGSHNHSLHPTHPPKADPQDAAGPAEDEVLSPHLSRLAETSPHANAAEPVALSLTAISRHHENAHASSVAQQQPEDESNHHHALPDSEALLTAAPPGNQLEGAGRASAPAALPEAGPSTSEVLQPADVPVSRARRGYANGSAAPRHLTPVPPARRGGYSSHMGRSTATAAPSHNHTHDGTGSPAARSLPGICSPAAHGSMHHRGELAGPSRGAGGSPNTSMLRRAPASDSHGLHANDSRDAQLQQGMHLDGELAGVVDSFVGAIMQEGSDDEGNGEVVDERGMFQQCYKGHCNLSQNKEVCLLGSRDEFVTSGSDDGRIFIWSRHTGRLVNLLTSDDQNVTALAAHPSMPFLASAGSEPTIKLWSPQAEHACDLYRADAIMSQNARELAEGDRRSNHAGPAPMWLNMLGTVSAELRAPGEPVPARQTNPVRCTIM